MAYTDIDKPSDYFNTATYTGTGSAQSITTGFQPDWTWTKVRNTTGNHREQDSVRGTGSELYPNLTNAEATGVTQAITSWTSTGYNIGTDTGINTNGNTYVSWNWLAGGTGVSNTQGSITSTVSANTTSGFSIATYTGNQSSGATFGHGLGTTPSCFIIKCKSTADIWVVYHKSLGGGDNYLRLNTNGATYTGDNVFASTAPSSSLITLGDVTSTNYSGRAYVCYSFAEKKGFSKFGSYTGNGSTDGTFVYTGFKPAFVLIKNISIAQDWFINDNKRLGYNGGNYVLYPDLASAEASSPQVDILSNGFKTRTVDAMINNSGYNYIYMAFANEPFTTSTAIPCTAR